MADLTTLLSYVHTGLAVLLRMSQSAEGATAILSAGLFASIRDSQLFATDPDIGLDVDNAEALGNFYRLLASLLRVVIGVVVTKGARNQQVIAQARKFLDENRQCMQGVFKAANRGGDKVPASTREALEDLVDGFTVLISASGFLEVSINCDTTDGSSMMGGFSFLLTRLRIRLMKSRWGRDRWVSYSLEQGTDTREY